MERRKELLYRKRKDRRSQKAVERGGEEKRVKGDPGSEMLGVRGSSENTKEKGETRFPG